MWIQNQNVLIAKVYEASPAELAAEPAVLEGKHRGQRLSPTSPVQSGI